MVLNVAEGGGCADGRRRNSYQIALGEAREALATLEVAVAIGYLDGIQSPLRGRFHRIIGTLVRLVY